MMTIFGSNAMVAFGTPGFKVEGHAASQPPKLDNSRGKSHFDQEVIVEYYRATEDTSRGTDTLCDIKIFKNALLLSTI
jgi:hypothetical protein